MTSGRGAGNPKVAQIFAYGKRLCIYTTRHTMLTQGCAFLGVWMMLA